MNWNDWYILYMTNRMNQERLGQAFCNDFICYSWPELYYCEDNYQCYSLIWDFLESKQYDPFMKLNEFSK